jgi:hypothetical protein
MTIKSLGTELKKDFPQLLKLPVLPGLESYNDDVLTPEEVNEAVFYAREKKLAHLKELAYAEKLRQPKPILKLTPEQLFEIMGVRAKELGINLSFTDEERKIAEILCHYFSGSDEFESMGEGFSLKKGILLHGNIGCGKTTMFKLLATNPHSSYHITTCRYIASEFAKKGYEAIEKYYQMIPAGGHEGKKYGQDRITVCFDDLGTEASAKNYGNESNVMADIILSRYESKVITHLSTNLDANLIEEHYGARVRSRMREMFNKIAFPLTSTDKRK